MNRVSKFTFAATACFAMMSATAFAQDPAPPPPDPTAPAPGSPAAALTVDFDYEATVQRSMGGDRDANGTTDRMTSVRDRRGALVNLDLIVNGIWYNEGRYSGSGNLPVYGSILMKTGFNATGTPDIFYNEGIALGDFPPPEMKIPRVYASQVETD